MGKSLIVCCDGTWNTPDQQGRPTNVTKMTRAILPRAPDGSPQIVFYNQGVGVGNFLERVVGGALGSGLSDNVQQAYRFLALNYEPGDRILMFGFSRGAYTVRSLAGLVNVAGLLRKGDLDQMPKVWDYYRTPPDKRRADALDRRWVAEQMVGVDLLGVWDTVGSLGVPGNFLGRIGRSKHAFHDVNLGSNIRRAYHALAIDEHRKNFAAAIWDTTQAAGRGQIVEQVWFAGAHSNVGGGYPDPTLSDIAFLWMCGKASALIALDEDYLDRRVEKVREDQAAGELVDSCTGLKWKLLGRLQREIGKDGSEVVHPSALRRYRHAGDGPRADPPFRPYPYAPTNLAAYLREKGEEPPVRAA